MPLARSSFGEVNKGVLEQNIFTKGKQVLEIAGMDKVYLITRDAIAIEQGVIELADKTKVPGGRTNSGEFGCTFQLASDEARKYFDDWYEKCIDSGDGAAEDCKREGKIIFYRNFKSQKEKVEIQLLGLFVTKLEFPELDMSGGDEGDSDAHVTCTMSYDMARLGVPNIIDSLATGIRKTAN
jgi:hypothetical protein